EGELAAFSWGEFDGDGLIQREVRFFDSERGDLNLLEALRLGRTGEDDAGGDAALKGKTAGLEAVVAGGHFDNLDAVLLPRLCNGGFLSLFGGLPGGRFNCRFFLARTRREKEPGDEQRQNEPACGKTGWVHDFTVGCDGWVISFTTY